MSELSSNITKNFDPAVIMAYQLLAEHVASGNAVTADLAKALADLTEVFSKHKVLTDSAPAPQPHR